MEYFSTCYTGVNWNSRDIRDYVSNCDTEVGTPVIVETTSPIVILKLELPYNYYRVRLVIENDLLYTGDIPEYVSTFYTGIVNSHNIIEYVCTSYAL